MPSPLNGLIVPAASPTSTQVGPTFGVTEPPIGRRPPVGRRRRPSPGEMPQYAGAVWANSSIRCDRVHRLPVAERRQQPDADVDRPVADREDPPVAGQASCRCGRARRGPTRSTGRRAAGSRSSRGSPCPAGSDRLRLGAERPPEPAVGAVGDDHVAGPDLPRRRRVALSFTTAPRTSPPSTIGAMASVPWCSDGAGRDGVLGDELVEVATAHDVAVRREHRVLRPLELEGDAVGAGPQAVVAMVAGGDDGRLEPHLLELVHRPRRQSVAAGLLAGEGLALDDGDVVAGLGRASTPPPPRRGRRRRRGRRAVPRRRWSRLDYSGALLAGRLGELGLARHLAEHLALVADDGEDLLLGEVGEARHHAAEGVDVVLAAVAGRVAVAAVGADGVTGGARHDPRQLVLEVREGQRSPRRR